MSEQEKSKKKVIKLGGELAVTREIDCQEELDPLGLEVKPGDQVQVVTPEERENLDQYPDSELREIKKEDF